jgi:hypothetical protein
MTLDEFLFRKFNLSIRFRTGESSYFLPKIEIKKELERHYYFDDMHYIFGIYFLRIGLLFTAIKIIRRPNRRY